MFLCCTKSMHSAFTKKMLNQWELLLCNVLIMQSKIILIFTTATDFAQFSEHSVTDYCNKLL